MRLVTPTLIRGSRPESIEELQKNIPAVSDIVNLESGAFEFFNNDKYEIETKASTVYNGINTIKIHKIQCSDIFPPTEKQIEIFLEIYREAQGITYIHCLHGKDRTGYMIAAFRMINDRWSYNEAVKEMFEHGFHKKPYLLWVPSLKKYEIKCGNTLQE